GMPVSVCYAWCQQVRHHLLPNKTIIMQYVRAGCPMGIIVPISHSQPSTGRSSSQERSVMTDTALALPGWRHIYSGKVRSLYEPEESSPGTSATLLVVATDRISAFDHILAPGIPEKGKILTQDRKSVV